MTADRTEAAAKALVLYESGGCCDEWPTPCALCDCFRDENAGQRAEMDRQRARDALAAADAHDRGPRHRPHPARRHAGRQDRPRTVRPDALSEGACRARPAAKRGTVNTDLQSHHIEGYARAALLAGRDGYFNVPLISHIDGNLWVGGCRDGVELDHDFRFVVSLYRWERYTLGPDTVRHEVEMYDTDEMPTREVLAAAVDLAADCVDKGKTLIHCQAGLNRSNLIAASVLIKRGMTPAAAINLLRERRSPVVLCNETFESALLLGDCP